MNQHRYYLPNDVNGLVPRFSPLSLKCIHFNTRSVRNKFLCLEEFFTEFSFQFSVIMLTETWSTSDFDVFRLPNYRTYYLNRTSSRGGGIALLLYNSTECTLLDCYSAITPDYEVLSLCSGQTVFSVCYRPPNGDVLKFFEFYDQFLAFVTENGKLLITGGDFNIDMGNNSQSARDFDALILSNGFINVINVPTRVTADCLSVLDLFITNCVQSN